MRRWIIGALVFGLLADAAWGETIELVTYYPAPQTADMHTRSLTVGTPYANESLLDGQEIIYSWLGVGPGLTAGIRPTQALPMEPLWVVGNILALGPTAAGANALFIADRSANDRLNGLQLRTNGAAQWTIGSRNGSENLHIYSDASATPATRLFIEQATGNVGIGTTTPAGRLHVLGADDVVSNVLFVPGADDAATPQKPEIRVGIGPGVDTTPPVSTLQVNGSVGFQAVVAAGNIALDTTHNVVLCNNGSTMTVGLPPAAQSAGRTYYIKKISNNAAVVVIDPSGNEGIDGQLTLTLYVLNDAVRIVCAGGAWYVISGRGEMAPHVAKMASITAQSIRNDNVPVKINLNQVEMDVGGISNAGSGRFVINRAGRYLITAGWQTSAGGSNTFTYLFFGNTFIYKNGSSILTATASGSTAGAWAGASDIFNLVPGDVIEMYVSSFNNPVVSTYTTEDFKPRMSVIELRP